MIRLGVNIDHIATIRNTRNEDHPNLVEAAQHAMKYGADSITIHLREDRRHIRDKDVIDLVKKKKIPINLELSINDKIVKLALRLKPKYVCLVPEKRNELTTEGGLNLKKNNIKLKKIVETFNKKNIRTCLFINPKITDIILSKEINAECIEIHTGKFSRLVRENKSFSRELNKIKMCSSLANKVGLEVHAGHGLDYKSAMILSKINEIKEFNIGHFIIGESIIVGLKKVIKKFKKICN